MLFQADRHVDWFTHSIGLVGGVTAQSYQSLGLLKTGHEIIAPAFSLGSGDSFAALTAATEQHHSESHTASIHQFTNTFESFSDSGIELSDLRNSFDSNAQSTTAEGAFEPIPLSSNNDLVFSNSLSELSNVESPFQEQAESELSLSAGSSLFDLPQQTFEQTTTQQSAFSEPFSGERQSALRADIEEGGANLRQFFSDEIEAQTGGRLQAEVNGLLESVGVQPDHSVDVYGSSRELISDALDAAVQPIGAVSLPMVGPTLVAAREDLFGG